MPQPEYVPVTAGDQVRPVERLPAPRAWRPDRPADLHGPAAVGRGMGSNGPDQGYALRLAHAFDERAELAEGDQLEDAKAGCVAVAMKRASVFGRAPVMPDLEHAFTLWGYLGDAPDELVALRRRLFPGAAHHYWDQRVIVDRVPETTLRLTPDQVRQRLAGWSDLISAG